MNETEKLSSMNDHVSGQSCHNYELGMIEIDSESGEDEESEQETDDFIITDGFEEIDIEYDDLLFDDNVDNEIEWL